MNVNRNFIKEMTDSFYKAFQEEDDWCSIAAYEPDNNSYRSKKFQILYALRYLPAYYFEYCILADELRSRLLTNSTYRINIASLGCGLAPDYYAFRDNLNSVLLNISFDYRGYDAVSWETRCLMPKPKENCLFINREIEKIDNVEIEDIDVFLFPKSMGDIANSCNGAMANIAKKIALTPKNKLYFLNSYVNNNSHKSSVQTSLFRAIHDELGRVGFLTHDDYEITCCPCKETVGLAAIDSGFDYPNKNMIQCSDKSQRQLCYSCNVIKKPILRSQFLDYQLLEYTRNDN